MDKFYRIFNGEIEPDDTIYNYDYIEEYYMSGNENANATYDKIRPLLEKCSLDETTYVPESELTEIYNMVSDDDY